MRLTIWRRFVKVETEAYVNHYIRQHIGAPGDSPSPYRALLRRFRFTLSEAVQIEWLCGRWQVSGPPSWIHEARTGGEQEVE